MNFLDSPDEAAFRSELRAWLVDNTPGGHFPERYGKEGNAASMAWHRTLYNGGWLGLSWPSEFGGRGLSPVYDAIVNEEVGAAGAPPVPPVGYLGRAIQHYGTPEQCERFLAPMLRGETQWCQGFSEPGAGSDLASLTTRAHLDGDHYVVNGQKVWTSRAQWADWCLLLCRTRPDLPKHKGLSVLVFPMDSPGITVRPLRQVWGTSEFNEVFFDDLRVPASQRIGQDGDGWTLATTVLAHERGRRTSASSPSSPARSRTSTLCCSGWRQMNRPSWPPPSPRPTSRSRPAACTSSRASLAGPEVSRPGRNPRSTSC